MAPATVTRIAKVRAGLALTMARELARAVSLDDRGTLHGPAVVLDALCRYVGADARRARAGAVWVAPKHRTQLRTIGVRLATAPAGLKGAA
jgi:hypothetical protein